MFLIEESAMRARWIVVTLATSTLATSTLAISTLATAILATVALIATDAAAQTVESAPTPEQRMQARFPQPARVGDLIGLPVLDDGARTLGYVREIVRTTNDKIALIVDYDGFLGWRSRPVAVPLEVVGIAGRHISSLDMPRHDYETAPTWKGTAAQALSADTVIKIALARH
jgi:PRC-barrel domain protein